MEYFKGIIRIESAQKMTKEEVYKAVKGHLNIDFEVFYKSDIVFCFLFVYIGLIIVVWLSFKVSLITRTTSTS